MWLQLADNGNKKINIVKRAKIHQAYISFRFCRPPPPGRGSCLPRFWLSPAAQPSSPLGGGSCWIQQKGEPLFTGSSQECFKKCPKMEFLGRFWRFFWGGGLSDAQIFPKKSKTVFCRSFFRQLPDFDEPDLAQVQPWGAAQIPSCGPATPPPGVQRPRGHAALMCRDDHLGPEIFSRLVTWGAGWVCPRSRRVVFTLFSAQIGFFGPQNRLSTEPKPAGPNPRSGRGC